MQNVLRTAPRQSAIAASFAMLVAVPTCALAGASAPKEAGVWFDDSGKGAVKIETCGSKLCGRIVWLKSLVNDKGEPLVDRHNPEANLRTRPICGLQVVGQLDAMPDGSYDNGWIYDPKEGKSYSVAIKLSGTDELSVTGYKGVKLFSKTFVWKRAKTDLPSCATAAIETKAAPATGGATAAGAAAGAATGAKPVAPSGAGKSVVSPAAAATKTNKAGASEALPWADGKAQQQPNTKPMPAGASNVGAPKPSALRNAPSKPVKTALPAAKPGSAAAVQNASQRGGMAAKPTAGAASTAVTKSGNAPANTKPAPKKPQAPAETVETE